MCLYILYNLSLFFPESLFQLLLETTVRSTGPNDPTGQAITALSCACLFSLVVAWGDTGKILQAVSAILTNNGSHACQTIQVNNPSETSMLNILLTPVWLIISNPPPPHYESPQWLAGRRVLHALCMQSVQLPATLII